MTTPLIATDALVCALSLSPLCRPCGAMRVLQPRLRYARALARGEQWDGLSIQQGQLALLVRRYQDPQAGADVPTANLIAEPFQDTHLAVARQQAWMHQEDRLGCRQQLGLDGGHHHADQAQEIVPVTRSRRGSISFPHYLPVNVQTCGLLVQMREQQAIAGVA